MELSYPALSGQLDDEELAQNLLPQLMIGDTGSESPDQDILIKAQREAEESLHTLRYERVASRRASTEAEIKLAQQQGKDEEVTRLWQSYYDLLKQEKALAK
jgi:hypothetical protein